MSQFYRDETKSNKSKLQDLSPWEILLLNHLYSTSIFFTLESHFQKDEIDYNLIYQKMKPILRVIEEKARLNLLSDYISPLGLYKYNLVNQVSTLSNLNLLKTDNLDILQILSSLDDESKGKIFSISNQVLGSNSGSLDSIFLNSLNFLTDQISNPKIYETIMVYNNIKNEKSPYFFTDKMSFIDVLLLSALGRCKIWSKIRKELKNSLKVLPSIVNWFHHCIKEYKEFLEFQIHASIQSKRHIHKVIKKHNQKICHPEILKAVKTQNVSEVKRWLEDGVNSDSIDPDDKNKTLLHIACEFGNLEIIKLLEEYDCNFEALDFEQMTPIFYALVSDNLDVIEYLVGRGVDIEKPDCQNRTPFYWACCQCSPRVVTYMQKKGVNINTLSKLNRTPLTRSFWKLSKAAYIGRAEIVSLLLTFPNIDINQKGNRGRTALHAAVWGIEGGRDGKKVGSFSKGDCPEAAKALIDAGASLSATDSDGNTPLSVASSTAAVESLVLLINHKAELNCQNNRLETPLFLASKYGFKKICEILIEKGADPFIKDISNLDSIEVSIIEKHRDIIQLLFNSFEKDIFDNESYHENLLFLISTHFKSEGSAFLSYLTQKKIYSQYYIISQKTIEALLMTENSEVSDWISNLIRFNYSSDIISNYVKNILSISFKNNFPKIILNYVQSFEDHIQDLEIERESLKFILNFSSEDFIFFIENLNINIFFVDENEENFIFDIVRKRRTQHIISLFKLLSKHQNETLKVKNKFLKTELISNWKKNLSEKNRDGFTILDFTLISKAKEIYDIVKDFIGNTIIMSISIPKYSLKIVEKNPMYNHSKKENLISFEKEFIAKFDQKDSYKPGEIDNFLTKIEKSFYSKFIKCMKNENWIYEVLGSKPCIIISQEAQMQSFLSEIKEFKVIGVDVEYHLEENDTKAGFVTLIQISTTEKDYIIDAMILSSSMKKHLQPLFYDNDILKLFHGCESDLKWLKADFDIDVVWLYDTSKAYMVLSQNKQSNSLLFLAKHYLNINLDKTYQTSDWRIRPLPKGMIDYARKDSSVLLLIWYCQMQEVKKTQDSKFLYIKLQQKMIKRAFKVIEKSKLPRITLELLN